MSLSPPVLVPSQLGQSESSSTPSLSEGSSDGTADSLQKPSKSGVNPFPTRDVISKPGTVFDSTRNSCCLPGCEAALSQELLYGWSPPLVVM